MFLISLGASYTPKYPMKVSARLNSTARVLTSDEHRQLLQTKLDEKAKKEEEKLKRKEEQEQKRKDKDRKNTERLHNKRSKVQPAPICVSRTSKRLERLPRKNYAKVADQTSDSDSEDEEKLCCRCGNEDAPGLEPSIDWVECDSCQRWYHVVCEFQNQTYGPFICSRC